MTHKEDDRLRAWKEKIAIMFLVQEEVQRQDKNRIYQYYYPELAAREEQLSIVEAYLGHPIDKYYRDFLLCANGWRRFRQHIDLFGTEDLLGSDLMKYALELIETKDAAYSIMRETGFSKEELLPIAASLENRILHVITRPMSQQPGVVIWFDGQEIERYPNFEEYFLAMTDYSRYEIELLKVENGVEK